MSPSIGVYAASYWSYAAAKMAEYLDRVYEQGRTQPLDLLPAVYAQAKGFFALVLEAVGSKLPTNPCASFTAYGLAVQATSHMITQSWMTRTDADRSLVDYAALLDHLATQTEFSSEERIIAKELRDLFRNIARRGEEEDYASATDGSLLARACKGIPNVPGPGIVRTPEGFAEAVARLRQPFDITPK